MTPVFANRQFGRVLVISSLLALAGQVKAADLSLPITGNLLGSVTDATGTPQMGASVQLFNKYERLIARTLTNSDGKFAFAGLPADFYSVRVSLASFLPASRDKIAIKAGLDSLLKIHLATLFSNVELTYTLPDGAMTEDWKWVLRTSPATRPITRYLPVEAQSSSAEIHPRVFSGTHAMLSVSGGDGGLIDTDSTQGDFGTDFALATHVFGNDEVQVGGTFGQPSNFGPAAMGLAAIYSRNGTRGFVEPPSVTLTITQVGGIGQFGGETNAGGGPAGTSMLRTMSLSLYQAMDPLDNVHLEYGVTGESVDYVQHTARVSPFARVTVDAGKAGQVIAAYTDGGRPDELSAHQRYQRMAETGNRETDLIDTVSTLARLPQISERNHRLELQRTKSYEIGYSKRAGSRTYAASAFYEAVSNGRLNVAGNLSGLDSGNVLWDGLSTTATYNIGNYRREGYIASVHQKVRESLDLAVAYGRMGGFAADSRGLGASQKFLDEANHNVAVANVQSHIAGSGTQISASYGWIDRGAVVPRHIFTTQDTYVAPGLNIDVRQPLPSFLGMPGRLELTANLRNLLAQGYLPLATGDGHTLLIVQAPRVLRGGLNFIF